MEHRFKWLSWGRIEIGAQRIGNWDKRCLSNLLVRDAKDLCRFLLKSEMKRRPCCSQATSASGQHEAPCCWQDRTPGSCLRTTGKTIDTSTKAGDQQNGSF